VAKRRRELVSPHQVFVRREPDAFEEAPLQRPDTGASAYRISRPVRASALLSRGLLRCLAAAAAPADAPVAQGLNACADSFYSSQVRTAFSCCGMAHRCGSSR
jgi:uridine phosphorylase